MSNQFQVFWKIIKASIRNIIFFILATAAIAHLASIPGLKNLALLAAVLESFIIFITLSALIYFIYYTITTYPAMRKNHPERTFTQLYGYTLGAFVFRLIEVFVYIYILIFLYNLFLGNK
ncbi:hypothetical protein SAMN02745221_01043 [Thermosyntropha lipolytica DSM 11003]|uniref:Uncharacterized protein n=1 Tax=Thermosyntropha lipolytica DSM 11003 TaxID=1123382 RepID=A0A1M5MW78_9FIRM|nr:hypothetical protein [Thermosyntropha lipolytica]SHG81541.1 hypothetical protein SAMN02745221_01043 [Thermosyntropha lipolytica DSM 11003]